jgi:predicted Fe-Mo cluster-binding NifX family protein
MKVAVTSQGQEITSPVDPRFGRAKYFLVVDTEAGTVEVHDNAQNLQLAQGAGIQAGQTVVNLGVEAVITGNVGPKAYNVLTAGKVKIYPGVSGTAKEAIADFKAGKLKEVEGATVEGHWF